MVLPVYHYNNTKIYNVSGYDTTKLPEWLINKHRKKLKKDPDFGKRIDLIQDFEFPEASNQLLLTPNKQHIVATGVYKPQIRVFDLNHLTIKFERHTNSETISFVLLDDDWTKMALLQADRGIEFHTQGGVYYSTRIPKAGRCMIYDKFSADLYVCGSSKDIFRLNLDQGRFLAPFDTEINGHSYFSAIESIEQSSQHRLLAVGGMGSYVQLWDVRYKKPISKIILPANPLVGSSSVSSLKFLSDGLNLAVGLDHGSILMYDIRSNEPVLEKEHQYDLPIKKIIFHESLGKIISADAKIIKIWDRVTGQLMASIEPPSPINDICLQQDTGFLMLANEGPQMQSFFIPALGPAPKWCSFLDSITEEMEESPQPTVYDNYKFLTKEDLSRLYEKAKSIVNPFAYEEYRKKLIKDKISKETSTRITKKNIPKVNVALASKLQDSSKDPKKTSTILTDSRFQELFSNTEFEIDQESVEYRRLNPSASTISKGSISASKANLQQLDSSSSEDGLDPEDEEFGIRK